MRSPHAAGWAAAGQTQPCPRLEAEQGLLRSFSVQTGAGTRKQTHSPSEPGIGATLPGRSFSPASCELLRPRVLQLCLPSEDVKGDRRFALIMIVK